MRTYLFLMLSILSFLVKADTIDHYINISNNIPQMEMKADAQSQAWARSARNVLIITAESIAETLTQANDLAKSQGRQLFCLPEGKKLDAMTMNNIIVQTYNSISSQESDKSKMTVSQVAWLGVMKSFPCQGNAAAPAASSNSAPGKTARMQHMSSVLGLPS
ncbi:phosphatase [Legionella quinlivanii]|uniref:Phosphatase n=1 Tax=Legionella quinlivanii TaxID=45073 RepID=A0A0W0XZ31_9GAMM|nr:hypothetical protein [Legionella quinlivanii]KTD49711.1 phosphatase [Legionella quinlivanii]MCW8451927.1 phosphatase [Legionella quinlivanii]SEG23107.1 hypothetical protein SAMN02746093_02248 [Legionella quinlivanii DSM 21216]STY09876.1 phosphatase [Legionella quinlivanii]